MMALMLASVLPCGAYTFIPFGSAPPPSTELGASALVRLPACVAALSFQRCTIIGEWQERGGSLILLRADEKALATLMADCQQLDGAQLVPVDAGPFNDLHEAAALVERWRDDFWCCHRNEGRDGDTNSCFEFGGCHRRCWWRGTVEPLSHVAIECGGGVDPIDPALAGLGIPPSLPSAALASLSLPSTAQGERQGTGQSAMQDAKKRGTGQAKKPPLVLVAHFERLEGMGYFCSLRPQQGKSIV
jgi:hypothetical protein